MGKKSRKKNNQAPEGMNHRQMKLVARAAECAALLGNPCPFEDLDGEAGIVAVHEFAPAVVIPVTVAGAERDIELCTVLPGGVAALTRTANQGNEAFIVLQTQVRTSDGAADLFRALAWAYDVKPGQQLSAATDSEAAPFTDVPTAVDLDNLEIRQDFE